MRWLCVFIIAKETYHCEEIGMNFLAHLHIAEHCQSSLLGNLLGDFVKGNPENKYPSAVVQGIQLHRFVDRYTDNHPLIHQLKPRFDGESRRFCPIALDMFWDHCLASQWAEFDPRTLGQFCQQAQQQVEAETRFETPEKFQLVSQSMWRGRWLESYQQQDNIEFALRRIATRSPRMARLTTCIPILFAHYDEFSAVFGELYRDVLTAAKRQTIC